MTTDSLLPIPPGGIIRLREMTRSEASVYLGQFQLTQEALDRLLSIAQPDTARVVVTVVDPLRRRFFAAAWIAGASTNYLGQLYGNITRQSVLQQLDKILPGGTRRTMTRLMPVAGKKRLSFERLGRMRELFYSDAGLQMAPPVEAAEALLGLTEDWVDE